MPKIVQPHISEDTERKYAIHFDYDGEDNPEYSSNPDAMFNSAYIVEFTKDYETEYFTIISEIVDYNNNIIDITDTNNVDLIERINETCYIDLYKSYDIAKHNMIYIIYFVSPEYNFPDTNEKNKDIYKKIRDNISYTGKNYYYNRDGVILRECFHINGNIEGKFIGYTDPNSYSPQHNKIYEIDYVDGKIHGKYIKKYHNKMPQMECNFENDKIIGKFMSYNNDNSEAVYCEYVDGNIEGIYICFGERNYCVRLNGERIYNDTIDVMVTNYVNNLENGKRCIYKYSCSEKKYYIKSECEYVNGMKNGIKNIYDDNNKIVETISYMNNKKHGLRTYMNRTKYGNGYYISIEKTYKDGNRNGINKYYNDLGQITMTKEYKDDCVYNVTHYYSTGVKKESLDIKYCKGGYYSDSHYCTKEINTIKKFNESGELISTKKEKIVIEHDGYEHCDDSDYEDLCYTDDKFYEKNKEYITFNKYKHF